MDYKDTIDKGHYHVAIIGTGPSGLTAGLYTARANLEPLIFEGMQPGGQLTITTEVENYPGFVDGILGPELMDNFRAQAKRFGAEVVNRNVVRVELDTRPFKVHSENLLGDLVVTTADALIISTGATSRTLGLDNEMHLMGYGVSTCATCDGAFFKDKKIIVVGAGDSAMEEATFLTRFASSLTIVHRREVFRASKIMLDRARANKKISWEINKKIKEIKGTRQGGVTSVILEDTQNGALKEVPVDGVFYAIGHTPNTKIFEGLLEMDAHGYLVTQPGSTRTRIEGVFAAGDVQDSVYRQAITAAGTGCMAALEAERWLESRERA